MRVIFKLPIALLVWSLVGTWPLFPVLFGAAEALAQESDYYRDMKKGWWWYQDPPKDEPKKEELKQGKKSRRLPSMKDYTREQLWRMHPDDFQELLMDFQKKAVMELTEESVSEYLVMQDIASKRSLAYANVAAYVQQKNPELGVPEYSVAAPGMAAATRMRNDEIEGRIRAAKDDYALLYFYSPGCEFCKAQDGILRFFQDKYDWEIRAYELNSALASRLNITIAPSTVLIYRNSRDYIPVSAGVMSLADIELRLYRGMRLLAGENSPQNFSLYEFQKGGSFDAELQQPGAGTP